MSKGVAFAFDSMKLRRAAAAASPIELDAVQERLVKDITDVVASRLGMDPIPCRGLWLKAIREWQDESGMAATAISAMNPMERGAAAARIKDHFTTFALEMLAAPDQKATLQGAIGEAFALYLARYNRRPRDGK
jgi:hypothetical protein